MAMMHVKRVGVLSYAKMMAVIMAGMGLIIGLIYGLIFMVFGAAIMASGGNDVAMGGGAGVVAGLVIIVAVPVLYGISGFVMGAIGAVIYNVAAGFVGGIEIELESKEMTYAAPPPPHWSATPQPPGQQPYTY